MIQLFFATAAFIMAGMALGLLVWRDSRPRRDEWQTIIRRSDLPTPHDRTHRYCDRKEREHDQEGR
jgi:hypothetical protein